MKLDTILLIVLLLIVTGATVSYWLMFSGDFSTGTVETMWYRLYFLNFLFFGSNTIRWIVNLLFYSLLLSVPIMTLVKSRGHKRSIILPVSVIAVLAIHFLLFMVLNYTVEAIAGV